MYILGFLAAGSHCIPRFWARLCANSCAMANGRPYYIWRKKKKEKDEYNASSFCLTMQLVFHKVTPVTIICAYSKNEHNEVPHRKNPPLLFWGESCTLVNLQRTVCLIYIYMQFNYCITWLVHVKTCHCQTRSKTALRLKILIRKISIHRG